jgi:hypothetical protein
MHLRRAAEVERQKRQQEENIKKQFLGIGKMDKSQQDKGGLWTSLSSVFSFGCGNPS